VTLLKHIYTSSSLSTFPLYNLPSLTALLSAATVISSEIDSLQFWEIPNPYGFLAGGNLLDCEKWEKLNHAQKEEERALKKF